MDDREEISLSVKEALDSITHAQVPATGRNRQVYDLQFNKRPSAFPGVLVRSEGEPSCGDKTADTLYDNMGVVYDFFEQAFGDTNIFRDHHPPIGIVHYDFYYAGAWFHVPYPSDSPISRHQALICGDGWDNDPWNQGGALKTYGGCFGNFAASIEVVAHEMAHGFVNAVCGLGLGGEPGIIHEHLADVFGIMCEQFSKGQAVEDGDWLVGEDLVAPEWKGVAMRSFKAPGTAYLLKHMGIGDDPQVGHMNQFYAGTQDGGGVHINSGIPNRAFYLVATGLGDKFSWERAGRIWYAALTRGVVAPDCGLERWAMLTLRATKKTLKYGPVAVQVVWNAWKEVGIILPAEIVS